MAIRPIVVLALTALLTGCFGGSDSGTSPAAITSSTVNGSITSPSASPDSIRARAR